MLSTTNSPPPALSSPAAVAPNAEVELDVKKSFQDLIETVISTIQEPEVTEAGVTAVMAKLHAYSAGINRLVDSLPPNTANGADGHLGLGGIGV